MAGAKVAEFKQPFDHLGTVRVRVLPVQTAGRVQQFDGFGGLTLETGTADVRLSMTPEQMRELAALLVAQSWETDARG